MATEYCIINCFTFEKFDLGKIGSCLLPMFSSSEFNRLPPMKRDEIALRLMCHMDEYGDSEKKGTHEEWAIQIAKRIIKWCGNRQVLMVSDTGFDYLQHFEETESIWRELKPWELDEL